MPQMNYLIKPASGLCNLKCDYCFYADEICARKQTSCSIMSDDDMTNRRKAK